MIPLEDVIVCSCYRCCLHVCRITFWRVRDENDEVKGSVFDVREALLEWRGWDPKVVGFEMPKFSSLVIFWS
jgi:hypothetical protein